MAINHKLAATALVVHIGIAGCGDSVEAPTPTSTLAESAESADLPETTRGDEIFPDVVDATARRQADGTWTFSATLSSPYDTPNRYADAWRILGPDGTELGVRVLMHDHANEQPFTRSLSGVEVPDHVDEVAIQGRDQLNGWGGTTVTLRLDRNPTSE